MKMMILVILMIIMSQYQQAPAVQVGLSCEAPTNQNGLTNEAPTSQIGITDEAPASQIGLIGVGPETRIRYGITRSEDSGVAETNGIAGDSGSNAITISGGGIDIGVSAGIGRRRGGSAASSSSRFAGSDVTKAGSTHQQEYVP